MAKGIIVIRVEDTEGFDIQHNHIGHVESFSMKPFDSCTDFHAGRSSENPMEQQIGNVRAISVAATRPYTADTGGKPCTIKRNKIASVDSLNGNLVVGIDIQGETAGIEITKNSIDLQEVKQRKTKRRKRKRKSVKKDKSSPEDKYIGIRVRENVDGSSVHIDKTNKIEQPIQVLARERRLRRASMGNPHGFELEWEYGGCPFANKRGVPQGR